MTEDSCWDEAHIINLVHDLAVGQCRTDREISIKLNLTLSRVYFIRALILGISATGRKRICEKCGQLRSVVSYRAISLEDEQYFGWCIVCRREAGITSPYPFNKSLSRRSQDTPLLKQVVCLNCDDLFESEIAEQTPLKTVVKNRLCEKCRNIEENPDFGTILDIEF